MRVTGNYDWYEVGARQLLDTQDKREGSWLSGPERIHNMSGRIIDTCFAILFLKRATAPLDRQFIETGKKKDT